MCPIVYHRPKNPEFVQKRQKCISLIIREKNKHSATKRSVLEDNIGKNETAMEQPDHFPSFQGLSSILTKAFYRDLLYITQPLTYIRVEALKKGTSFPQPTSSRVPHLRCIWMSLPASGLGNLTTDQAAVSDHERESLASCF